MNTTREPENADDTILYCNTTIRRLLREREKITRTGRLTADQDLRLDEIDSELEYWSKLLDSLEYEMEEYEEMEEEEEEECESES